MTEQEQEWILRYESGEGLKWTDISRHKYLSEEFMEMYAPYLRWMSITVFQRLSESFMERNHKLIYWNVVACGPQLNEEFLEKHKNKLSWRAICTHQKLSEDFIRRNAHLVDWYAITNNQNLSEDFLKEFHHKINWKWWFTKYEASPELLTWLYYNHEHHLADYKKMKNHAVFYNIVDSSKKMFVEIVNKQNYY